MELLGVGFVILFLLGFFSSSDSTGGGVDAVDEDGPWAETDPMFYEMHDDAMDFLCRECSVIRLSQSGDAAFNADAFESKSPYRQVVRDVVRYCHHTAFTFVNKGLVEIQVSPSTAPTLS